MVEKKIWGSLCEQVDRLWRWEQRDRFVFGFCKRLRVHHGSVPHRTDCVVPACWQNARQHD